MQAKQDRPPLRIAVLANFESPHAWRWLKFFVERGHDVHAISFYEPSANLPGVKVHLLRHRTANSSVGGTAASAGIGQRLPLSLARLLNAWRFRSAGLRQVLDEIGPQVFHAHYVVEHGFFAAAAGYHPLVISGWGSDVLIDSHKALGGRIARWTLSRADFVTANDAAMARRLGELGVPDAKLAVIPLGLDGGFLPDEPSANLDSAPETIILFSDRALEPLYNIDKVIRAFAVAHQRLPALRLEIAHDGSQRQALQDLTRVLGLADGVTFLGRLDQDGIRARLLASHVYVSIPESDSFALSNLEAMACGAFPVLNDLPSVGGWIEDNKNGLLTQPDVESLAAALHEAAANHELRRRAVEINRRKVEENGLLGAGMRPMEEIYYMLAGTEPRAR